MIKNFNKEVIIAKKSNKSNIFDKKSKTIFIDNKKSHFDFFYLSNCENNLNKFKNTKHFLPAIKEWFNSICVYNKNFSFKSIPISDKIVNNLLINYFNLRPKTLEKFKKFSIKKIFVSRAEIKHTNNKVFITVYTFNVQNSFFIEKLKKFQKIFIFLKDLKKLKVLYMLFQYNTKLRNTKIEKYNKNSKKHIQNNTTNLDNLFWKEQYNSDNLFKNTFLYKKLFFLFMYMKKFNINTNIKLVNKITRSLNWKENIFNKFEREYNLNLINLLVKKEFKKILLCQYYIGILYFNNLKYKSKNLFFLNNIISNIYNKKVEFNIINLKYLHLNSDIFSQVIVKKLKNRKNKLLTTMKKALKLVKLPNILKYHEYSFKDIQSKNFKNSYDYIYMEKNVVSNKEAVSLLPKLKKLFAFGSIKYKNINGVRLEGAGRLTRRLTASRSVFKFKFKGGLKNAESSYVGRSTTILRGYAKSNIQYTNINSKTRNGAFGLKNWISNY